MYTQLISFHRKCVNQFVFCSHTFVYCYLLSNTFKLNIFSINFICFVPVIVQCQVQCYNVKNAPIYSSFVIVNAVHPHMFTNKLDQFHLYSNYIIHIEPIIETFTWWTRGQGLLKQPPQFTLILYISSQTQNNYLVKDSPWSSLCIDRDPGRWYLKSRTEYERRSWGWLMLISKRRC